jgi:hypothetical protein
MDKKELLEKTDTEIIRILANRGDEKSLHAAIDKTLVNFKTDDLKELITKMGGNRRGNISKRETFIKHIVKFIEGAKVDTDYYTLKFKNSDDKKNLLEILRRKINSFNHEEEEESEEEEEESEEEGEESEKKEQSGFQEQSEEEEESEEDNSEEEIEPVDSQLLNTTYLKRFENNDIVHHTPWDNSKIILSGKGTLIRDKYIFSPLKEKGVNVSLGSKIYVTNENAPLNNHVNKCNCIIAIEFSYHTTKYYGCIMSGLILKKSDFQEEEANICNEHLCITNNQLKPILRIGKYGVDYNNNREGDLHHFFIGKEWIDKSSKRTYMYDVHPKDDLYQCYLPSKSLSKDTDFTQYKLSKVKLVKCGRTFKKHTE